MNLVHVTCDHPRGRAVAARLKRRAAAFLSALGKEGVELSVLLVGDRGIRRLNREWRGKDLATDVLSFPAAAPAGNLLGDVVVSLDMASRVAKADGRTLPEELDRYLVHGILHLLGFDHETPGEATAMAAREDEVLARHGLVSAAAAERGTPGRAPRREPSAPPAKKPAKKPARKPTRKPARKSARKSATKPAGTAARKPPRRAATRRR